MAAEAVNALFKTELTRGPDRVLGAPTTTSSLPPWAGCTGADTGRIHSYLNDLAPDQSETAYAAENTD